jgi:hypothetical protein
MSGKRFTFAILVLVYLLTASLVWAETGKTEEDRWYGTYYQGQKRGNAHATYTDYTDAAGIKFREIDSTAYVNYRGSTTASSAKKTKTKQFTFKMRASHEIKFQDGVVILLNAKRTATRQSILRAKSSFENGTLTVMRTEGVVDSTLKIKKGDYDLTSDPAHMEPFLKTVTTEPTTKKVFSFQNAEIKAQTFHRLDDGKADDETGTEKEALVYKVTDEDGKSTIKTIDGKIVYSKYVDEDSGNVIVWQLMDKKRAKSDTGF